MFGEITQEKKALKKSQTRSVVKHPAGYEPWNSKRNSIILCKQMNLTESPSMNLELFPQNAL